MKVDLAYAKISKHFHENPDEFADAFTKAWYRLTHRDTDPLVRYLGEDVPAEELIWQDPVPKHEGSLINESLIAALKEKILNAGLTVRQLVTTAWSSASTYRGTDRRCAR